MFFLFIILLDYEGFFRPLERCLLWWYAEATRMDGPMTSNNLLQGAWMDREASGRIKIINMQTGWRGVETDGGRNCRLVNRKSCYLLIIWIPAGHVIIYAICFGIFFFCSEQLGLTLCVSILQRDTMLFFKDYFLNLQRFRVFLTWYFLSWWRTNEENWA